MIYVWDNGEQYSDHTVYFVDGGHWPHDFVLLVLEQKQGHLVFTAEKVKWRVDEAFYLTDWLSSYDFFRFGEPTMTNRALLSLIGYHDQGIAAQYVRAVAERTTGRWREKMLAETERLFPREP